MDLNRDGRSEIIVGLTGQNWGDRGLGRIEVLHADGTRMPGWPVDPVPSGENIISALAVADVDNNGSFDVVAGIARRPDDQEGEWWDGAVLEIHAFDGAGSPLLGFPVLVAEDGLDPWVDLSVCDLDDDGGVDFVTTHRNANYDGVISAVSADGNPLPGWPRTFIGAGPSLPATGDVDYSGTLNVVVGTEGDGLYLLADDGSSVSGWPVDLDARYYGVPLTVSAPPVNEEGRIAATYKEGGMKWLALYRPDGTQELVLRIPSGEGAYVSAEVTLGDIDGDLQHEMTIPRLWRDEPNGSFDSWKTDGSQAPGWPVKEYFWIEGDHQVNSIVADINGDGRTEVLLGTYTVDLPRWPSEVRNKGWLEGWTSEGAPMSGFPIGFPRTEVGLENGALGLGDVNGDGFVDLAMVRCEEAISGNPATYVSLITLGCPVAEDRIQWGRYHHDPFLTGNADASCADGPVVGTCSQRRPFYCGEAGGPLLRACDLCGCPPGGACVQGGWCVSVEAEHGAGHR